MSTVKVNYVKRKKGSVLHWCSVPIDAYLTDLIKAKLSSQIWFEANIEYLKAINLSGKANCKLGLPCLH
jgi:hypothetical protein